MLLLVFFPSLIEAVESRQVSVNEALQSVAARMDVDFPGLRPLLRRLVSATPGERCTVTELLAHDLFRSMTIPAHWSPMRPGAVECAVILSTVLWAFACRISHVETRMRLLNVRPRAGHGGGSERDRVAFSGPCDCVMVRTTRRSQRFNGR